jgi:hypothetical protein
MAASSLKELILKEEHILNEQFAKMQNLVNVLPDMLSRAKYDRIIEILDELRGEIDILKNKVEKEKGALDVW